MDRLNSAVALHERFGVAIPGADAPKFETRDGCVAYLSAAGATRSRRNRRGGPEVPSTGRRSSHSPGETEETAMRLPLQIAFHNLPHSDEVEAKIRAEAERLDDFHDRIMSGRVVVDVPHRHHQEGNLYQVLIDLKVPGGEVVVRRDPAEHAEYRDLDRAIRDAFDEARRQLEDRLRVERGQVKTNEALPHARVVRLFPERGYGFLETPDGREIYFHEHSVLGGGFGALEVGAEVRFAEEEGEKGPQASTVHPVGRHGGL